VNLVDEVMGAYGGAERWEQIDAITIHQIVGGVLWPLKGVDSIISDSHVRVQPKDQRVWHHPLPQPGQRSSYSPELVTIETDGGQETLETLPSPRDSFAEHSMETPWSMLQLAYFAGYAMWTYLSEPYSLTFPGVKTDELGDWQEKGQRWRRLGVQYPSTIATHCTNQVLYVDSDGLLRRRDYEVDIIAGAAAAHYSDEHKEFDGIVVPVKRVVYARDAENHPIPEIVSVTIDIDEVVID
jgi:hypothetical protein